MTASSDLTSAVQGNTAATTACVDAMIKTRDDDAIIEVAADKVTENTAALTKAMAPINPPANSIIVNGSDELNAAYEDAVNHPGQTIMLAPGTYNGFFPANRVLPDITFTSADPSNPAVMTALNMTNVSGATFANLAISTEGSTNPAPNRFTGCSKLVFANLSVHGAMDGDPAAGQTGLYLDSCDDVTVKNSEFQKLNNAIAHVNCTNLLIDSNSIHDGGTDGVHGGGSSFVTISKNHIASLYPDGEHPDAIQFWTVNTTAPATNIAVIDNLIDRGNGQVLQGVFFGNENQINYEHVTITTNVVIGAAAAGVAIGWGDNVTIDKNKVIPLPDQESWISLNSVTNATVTGNASPKISYINTTPITDSGNVVIESPTDLGISEIDAWMARHPGVIYGIDPNYLVSATK